MSIELKSQSNVEIIYQALKDVHQLLCFLEEQVRSELFIGQPEVEIEIVGQEEQSLVEDDSSQRD